MILASSGYKRETPYSERVNLTITRILAPGQRLWDADSVLRGNAKELIDALVELGWFKDDGPRCIGVCDGRQDVTRRVEGAAVEIRIDINRQQKEQ